MRSLFAYRRFAPLPLSNARCKSSDSFLTSTNAQYLDHLNELWRKDAKSVPESWNNFFKKLESGNYAPLTNSKRAVNKVRSPAHLQAADTAKLQGETVVETTLNVNHGIRSYQSRGHLIADIDPLGIQNPESAKLQESSNLPPELVVHNHFKGLTENDLNREFPLGSFTVIGGVQKSLQLREIIKRLNKIYCGHLGLEYTYITDSNVIDWLRHKFEIPNAWVLESEHRKWIWVNIMKSVMFEAFLAKKFPTEKRFGLEGCESFVASMNECLETGAENGVETTVIGMAHRGRLNTLINVCEKPLHQLLTQFRPLAMEEHGSGDVKYHLGSFSEKMLKRSGLKMTVSMLANPSHLEAIDPLAIGRVKAEQIEKADNEHGKRSVAILVHGDSAYSGQGICYETMVLTKLPDYSTGGVIHTVINNQIGFTTEPQFARSGKYCTDVGRITNAPVFHVHGDDPDLVVYCSKVASQYRSTYHNDVVLDIVGYRRNGHNEMDEPSLTQPHMYRRIKSHPSVLSVYSDRLLREGVIDEAFVKEGINMAKAGTECEAFKRHCIMERLKAI